MSMDQQELVHTEEIKTSLPITQHAPTTIRDRFSNGVRAVMAATATFGAAETIQAQEPPEPQNEWKADRELLDRPKLWKDAFDPFHSPQEILPTTNHQSLENWEVGEEVMKSVALIESEMKKIHSDIYLERERASTKITKELQKLQRIRNPLPPPVAALFTKYSREAIHDGEKEPLDFFTSMQSIAMRGICDEECIRYPSLKNTVGGHLKTLRRSDIRISLDPSLQKNADTTTLQTCPDKNSGMEILKVLLDSLDATVEVDPKDPNHFLVVPRSHENRGAVASGNILGILRANETSEWCELRYDPSGGKIIGLTEGQNLATKATVKNDGPGWINGTQVTREIPTSNTAPDKFGISIAKATKPETQTVKFPFTAHNFGSQRLSSSTKQNENGKWVTTMQGTICGDIPWPPTPTWWDALSYSVVNENRYDMRNEDGEHLAYTVKPIAINQRQMIITIETDEKPDSMDMTYFTEFDYERHEGFLVTKQPKIPTE